MPTPLLSGTLSPPGATGACSARISVCAVGLLVGACTHEHAATDSGVIVEPESGVLTSSLTPEAGAPEAAAKKVQRRPPPDDGVVRANPSCALALASDERIARRVIDRDDAPPGWGAGVWYGSDESRGDALAGFGPGCLPQRDGSAWSIELLDAPLRWTIAHYDPGGRRTALPPSPIDSAGGGGRLGPGNSIAYDFDGDGLDEVWSENTRWCDRAPAPKLYTFRAGHIAAYPVPRDARVDEVVDEDRDGVPDLVTGSLLQTHLVRCNLGEIVCTGYSFRRLLHARPGGAFAEDDVVAVAFAQKQCPPPGGPIVAFDVDAPGKVDGEATANNIACARLRGIPADAVVAELHANCPSVMRTLDPRAAPRRCTPGLDPIPCTPAEEQTWSRTCPAPPLHPTCIDWMLDLAREQPTPILATSDGGGT